MPLICTRMRKEYTIILSVETLHIAHNEHLVVSTTSSFSKKLVLTVVKRLVPCQSTKCRAPCRKLPRSISCSHPSSSDAIAGYGNDRRMPNEGSIEIQIVNWGWKRCGKTIFKLQRFFSECNSRDYQHGARSGLRRNELRVVSIRIHSCIL